MTIVVGTDFSEGSSRASRIGARLARALSFSWRERRRVRVIAGSASADTHLAVLSEHADLVVGLGALVLGSTAHEILARSHVPVFVVPPVRE